MAKKKKGDKSLRPEAIPDKQDLGCVKLTVLAVDGDDQALPGGFTAQVFLAHRGALTKAEPLLQGRVEFNLRGTVWTGEVQLLSSDDKWATVARVDLTKNFTIKFVLRDCP